MEKDTLKIVALTVSAFYLGMVVGDYKRYQRIRRRKHKQVTHSDVLKELQSYFNDTADLRTPEKVVEDWVTNHRFWAQVNES